MTNAGMFLEVAFIVAQKVREVKGILLNFISCVAKYMLTKERR